MSSVTISYKSLSNASSEAKSVAKKLNSYADSIQKTVYNKLNRYSGDWTNSICSAYSHADAKMTSLRAQADSYNTYASNLIDLRDECKSVDEAVRSKVSSLTASFKEAHGIRNSAIENAISYFFTSIGNSSFVGRWVGDRIDLLRAGRSYLKDSIKEWYNYKGGKELLKGVAVGLLEIAIGVLAVAAAILTGGAFLVVLAGVILGVIGAANGIMNIVNEFRAYDSAQTGDPATARRLSAENTLQDTLRDGNITKDPNEGWLNQNVKFTRAIAGFIDVVSIACTVITVVSGVGKLLKNGYKWATGNSLKEYRAIFSKDFFAGIGKNLKTGWGDIKTAWKMGHWSAVKHVARRFSTDFKYNFGKSFMDFRVNESLKGIPRFKHGIVTSRTILSVTKTLVSKGYPLGHFNEESFGIKEFSSEILLKGIMVPCITVFTVPVDPEKVEINNIWKGQTFFDFYENITAYSFYKEYDRITSKMLKPGLALFDQGSINIMVENKLSAGCKISVSIPEIHIPEIPVMYVA